MRNISIFSVALIFTICIIFPAFSQTESITITTYYPAPFGVYTNLRLFPSAQPTETPCQEGTMYYDNTDNQVMVCGQDANGNPVWQDIGLWTRNGNNVFLADTGWNVGIGTNNPQATLDVAGGIRIGDFAVCGPSNAGTMRYHGGQMQFCDNSGNWTPVGGGPHFIAPVLIWTGRDPTPGWVTYDASNDIPEGAKAVILEASTTMAGPDTNGNDTVEENCNTFIIIRKDASSPYYNRLFRGRSAAGGDAVAWANQGAFPVSDLRTFQYAVFGSGFKTWKSDKGRIRLIGYYD